MAGEPAQEPVVTIIQLCDFRVPKYVAQANATFAMTFEITIGANGEPDRTTVVEEHFLDPTVFIKCMRNWRLPVKPGEKLRVEFVWKHAEGWSEVRVGNKSFVHLLKIAPYLCDSPITK